MSVLWGQAFRTSEGWIACSRGCAERPSDEAWNTRPLTASILDRVPEGCKLDTITLGGDGTWYASIEGPYKDGTAGWIGYGPTPEQAVSDAAGRIGGSIR